jgi:phosphocarrier protein
LKEKSDKPHAKTGAGYAVVKKFIIKNKLGLHARPAALFVQAVAKFESEVHVQKGKQKVNGKSIMGLMMLAAGSGSQVTIDIKGPDAEQAMAVVEKLFASGFGEE